MDGGGEGFAPDETDELVVGGQAPMLAGGFGVGVDMEAAEEAVDALVGEAAFAQDAEFFEQERVGRRIPFGDGDGLRGLGVRIGHGDYAFSCGADSCRAILCGGAQGVYRHRYKTHQ